MANGKGIAINFLADVRDFLRGTKNVEEELDDVADSLDDLAKDGENAVEDLEKGFNDLRKAAKAAGDDIEKGLGDGTKKGAKQGESATEVYKKEAIANISEVTSSFTGSWESAADAVQGTLGGVVADLGPVGAAAGAAGALGIGVLTAALVKMEEDAKKAQERIADLAIQMIDAGTRGEIPLEVINDNLKLIISSSEEATKKFRDIQLQSKLNATDANRMAVAYAGNEKAIESQLEVLEKLIEAEKEQTDTTQTVQANEIKRKALIDQQNELKKVQTEIEKAREIEQTWLNSGGAEFIAKEEAIAQIDAAYDEAVYGIDGFLNAETGIYDLDAFAQSIRDREQLLLDYQNALAESDLTTSQKAALNSYGVEQAAAILQGLKDPNVSKQTKDTIKKGLKEASKEGSGVAQEEIKKAFQEPIDAKVQVKADTAAAQRDLDNLIKARTAIIRVDFRDRNGKRID
jgi:hypothetical protein